MSNSEFENLIYLFYNDKKSLSSNVKKIQCRLKFHEKIYLDKKAIKISLFILKTKNAHKYDFLIGLPLKFFQQVLRIYYSSWYIICRVVQD